MLCSEGTQTEDVRRDAAEEEEEEWVGCRCMINDPCRDSFEIAAWRRRRRS